MKKILVLLLGLLLLAPAALADRGPADKQSLEKTNLLRHFQYYTINNIFSMYMNTIEGAVNLVTGQTSGFEYPKGSNKFAIYEDGFVYGGYFRSSNLAPRRFANGSTHRTGFQEGGIVTPGNGTDNTATGGSAAPESPGSASVRVYRVRPDVNPYDTRFTRAQLEEKLLNEEVPLIQRFQSFTAAQLYDNYKKDWDEWPVAKGAPYEDKNTNGQYDAAVDVPGVVGADQTLWHTSNDMSVTAANVFAGSLPVGIEIQRTIWGYNRQGALGNTLFMRYRFINKSGAPLDTMFAMLWSDPDLGYAGDDFTGCDTVRSIGYVYNGKGYDQDYGEACPASGYTFFQGPLVPGDPNDVGIFDFKYRQGYKNLKMYAFNMFINAGGLYGDPGFGNSQFIRDYWWHLMNGTVGSTGDAWVDPFGNETRYVLAGDPVSGAGWLDGTFATPGDRRLCMSTGPFFMQPMDTQEVVIAALVGQGTDRLSSVTALRAVSDEAQAAYNLLFDLPDPIESPPVIATPIDGGVILSWGDAEYIRRAEQQYESKGYTFEAYKVYQTPGASFKDPKTVAVFDIIDAAMDNNGVQRSITIKNDALKSKVMINGTQYFFGVSSIAYNPAGVPTLLEQAPTMIPVIPQTPPPGNRYATPGDTVKPVTQSGKPTDGVCTPIIVDGSKLNGHTYEVSFRDSTDVHGTTTTLWTLTDKTINKKLVTDWENQDAAGAFPIVDGMLIQITGPTMPGMKGYRVTGTRHITWAGPACTPGYEDYFEGFSHTITGDCYNGWYSGSSIKATQAKNTVLRYVASANGTWDPRAAQSDPNFSRGYRWLRRASVAPAQPSFAEWIVQAPAGTTYPYQDYNYSIPFAAYDLEVTPPRRLAVGHFENNIATGKVDGRYWPNKNDDAVYDNLFASNAPREWCFIFDSPYTDTPQSQFMVDSYTTEMPMMWWMIVNRRSGTENITQAGDEFYIDAAHLNVPGTLFSFTPQAAIINDKDLAKGDVENINVYPNPYFAFNSLEQNRYERFVTFTHMPQIATLRIIDVSGMVIRTIRKSDTSQFTRWDLKNEDGFPVASGVYIVYIDMPDLGKTKTIKVAVVQPQQILDHY